jgi:hypothetical protein
MKSSQSHFLVTVAGLDGTAWAKRTGGEKSGEASDVFDGGATEPDILAGRATIGELKVSRPFDPLRDQQLIKQLTKKVMTWRTTITQTPTAADLSTLAGVEPTVWSNALLVGLRVPEVDAGGSDAADYEMTFRVGSMQ